MKHGGNIAIAAAQFGFQPDEMIDLSTGISPRSFEPDLSALTPKRLRHLPQAVDEDKVKALMRTRWGVPDCADIALAGGSGLLINLMPRLRPKGQVALPNPTYSEHIAAWQSEGHHLISYATGGLPPISDDVRLVVGVQPGNPLGNCMDVADWSPIVDHITQNKNGLLVMDEAFIDLMPEQSLMPFAGRKGVIILRSFGKFYGLAGLRLGAAFGHPDDITRLNQMLGPWPVSTLALDVAAQALEDEAWAQSHRIWLAKQGGELRRILKAAGLNIIGGTDLYCLVDYGEGAEQYHQHLARQGIWTRVFDDEPRWIRFGLPEHDDDMARLKAAL